MNKLNICFFIDAFYPMVDGVIVHLNNIASILSKKHNVLVIAPEARTKYIDNFSYQVFRVPKIKVLNTDYDLALPNLIKDYLSNKLDEFNPDIIHVHSPFTLGKWGLNYAKSNNINSFITIHSKYKMDFFLRTKSKLITYIAFKNIINNTKIAKNIISVCSNLNDTFLQEYKLANKNLYYLDNATDLIDIEISHDKITKFKDKYDLHNKFILLFIGRIDKVKNIDFILKVLFELKKLNFKYKMLFVGDGPHMSKLIRLSKILNITDNVFFLGKITDKEKLGLIYKSSDLFLFPSKYDTFGIVKQEAAVLNTPSLMLKNATCSNGIIDKYNGYLEDEDINKFAKKIIEIKNDINTYNNVLQNLHTIVNTWNNVVVNLINLYKLKEVKR